MVFGLFLSAFGIYFNSYILPSANYNFTVLYKKIAQVSLFPSLNKTIINRLKYGDFIRDICIDNYNTKNREYYGLYIIENGTLNNKTQVIYAEKGQWLEDSRENFDDLIKLWQSNKTNKTKTITMKLELFNGYIIDPTLQNKLDTYKTFYKRMTLDFPDKKPARIKITKGLRGKTPAEILNDINNLNQANQNPKMWVEYYKRFTIPISVLAFILIAFPLGIGLARTGKSFSFWLTIQSIFIYYILYTFGETLAKTGYIHPLLGLSLPNIFFSIIGIILIIIFFKQNQQVSFSKNRKLEPNAN